MEERKTLGYDWEFGHEELVLEVGAYSYGDRLYIGLLHEEDGQMESFADLTINLPYSPAEPNEAYIDDFARQNWIPKAWENTAASMKCPGRSRRKVRRSGEERGSREK